VPDASAWLDGRLALPKVEFDYLFLASRAFKGKKFKAGFVFTIGFFLASCPWLIRNLVVNGNPFYSRRWFDFRLYFPATASSGIMAR